MADALRAYLLLAWMWTRAAGQYRASLALWIITQFVVTSMDLAVIAVLFAHTERIGDFGIAEVMFLYGTSYVAFGFSELLVGPVDQLGARIRNGKFDVAMIRPASTLAQTAADDFSPVRVAPLLQGLLVLIVALSLIDVPWTPARIAMVPVMTIAGAVLFGSVRVLGATFLFLVNEAAEVISAFTYGGNNLTQYPLAVYGRDAVRILVYIVPLGFVNWLPALFVLDRSDPFGFPAPLQFASPVVAAVTAVVAGAAWKTGIRHYRSTGS